MLASITEGDVLPDAGSFLPASTPFFASAMNPFLGQALQIRMVGLSTQVNFDDFQLDATPRSSPGVPEPSTVALIALGLAALVFRILGNRNASRVLEEL